MEKIIKISNSRVAQISVKIEIEKEALKEFQAQMTAENPDKTFEELADETLLNDKPFFHVRTREIAILSASYAPEATTLTGYDWKCINEAANALKEEVKAQPYSLSEYYS